MMTGGLDGLFIRVDEPAVKERELDGVKRIDVRLQARPEAPEPGIEGMRRNNEVPVVSDPRQVIERPKILGLPEVRVDDDDMLVGERQLNAGDEQDIAVRGVFLELGVERDDIVVGDDQGIETALRGPFDELL